MKKYAYLPERMGESDKSKDADILTIRRYIETKDPRYFSELYHRYGAKVYSKCLSLLKEEHLARDATQDIFLKIFVNITRFGEFSKFSTWLYSITYNYCIDALRKQKKVSDVFADNMDRLPDTEEEVQDEELLSMQVDRLRIVMEKIPVGDRAILMMKYQDDLSIKDIAAILKKTESAIKMKIKRAKHKAKMLYQENFPDN